MRETRTEASSPAPAPRSRPKSEIPSGHLSSLRLYQLGVTFAEYQYYASITRAREKRENEEYLRSRKPVSFVSLLKDRFNSGNQQILHQLDVLDETQDSQGEKTNGKSAPTAQASSASTDERHLANRALRTAGWGSVFYLITTDVLGPSSTP